MSSNLLLKMIVAPSKVATALNWRKAGGSVLNIDIHSDRIGLALGLHPSIQEEADTLDPIYLLPKGRLPEDARDKLSKIVTDQNVCGVVVSWPVQQDTGRMGAACGRVCHTLDELLSDSRIFASGRPLCLWDSLHSSSGGGNEDRWGRNSAYSRTCNKEIHLASAEQYHQNANVVATQVWDDFLRTHWPQLMPAR
jgi:RNase H-fold protein (predicted Holliday junction resolvase)